MLRVLLCAVSTCMMLAPSALALDSDAPSNPAEESAEEYACQETAFTPVNQALYLEAEHAMFERREPRRAASLLEQMAEGGLSCFEHFPVSMLRTHAEMAIIDPEFIYGEGVSQPVPLPVFDMSNHVIPYPDAAAGAGLEGDCTVSFDVSKTGAPRRVKAACSDPVFEDAAEAHVSRSRFEPVVENGKPVAFRKASLKIAFRLEAQDAESVMAFDRVSTKAP